MSLFDYNVKIVEVKRDKPLNVNKSMKNHTFLLLYQLIMFFLAIFLPTFIWIFSFCLFNLIDGRALLKAKTLTNPNKKVVCYYTNWSQYRPNQGKFVPEDIDPDICTHIIFAFGWLKKSKISAHDPTDETKGGKKGLYERTTELKLKNPKLKVLLAIGK